MSTIASKNPERLSVTPLMEPTELTCPSNTLGNIVFRIVSTCVMIVLHAVVPLLQLASSALSAVHKPKVAMSPLTLLAKFSDVKPLYKHIEAAFSAAFFQLVVADDISFSAFENTSTKSATAPRPSVIAKIPFWNDALPRKMIQSTIMTAKHMPKKLMFQ